MGVDVFKAEMNNLHLIPFELVGYDFDENSLRARFRYRGGPAKNPLNFEEIVDFSDRAENYNKDILDRALRLAFIVIGTSYYKAFPTEKLQASHLTVQTVPTSPTLFIKMAYLNLPTRTI